MGGGQQLCGCKLCHWRAHRPDYYDGALDNLVEGAARQAVQNMNLLFELSESEGLELVPCFP